MPPSRLRVALPGWWDGPARPPGPARRPAVRTRAAQSTACRHCRRPQTRVRSGTKSGESGSVTTATNSTIDCLAVVLRQLGSSSALICPPPASDVDLGPERLIKAAPAAPLARRQRRAQPFPRPARRTPGHACRGSQIKMTLGVAGRVASQAIFLGFRVSSSRTTASRRSLRSRRTRSASPTIDPAATHKELAPTRKDGEEQARAQQLARLASPSE